MHAISLKRAGYWLALVAAALPLTGCSADAAFGPEESSTVTAVPPAATARRAVDLGACQSIRPPEGSRLAFHAYAVGVQVYRWNGTSWVFNGPIATLYANVGGTGVVGSHYGGPTWEFNSGGIVVGQLSKRCDVAPADIPWLLLNVVRNEGPGVFHGVTHILRINTVGGQAPAGGGFVGEVRGVPYTAEYFFYRTP